jgi:hypothetical protein
VADHQDQQGTENSPTSDASQKKTLADLKGIQFDHVFYLSIALKAASELRTALKIDEGAFRKIVPSAWHDPRPAFIYRDPRSRFKLVYKVILHWGSAMIRGSLVQVSETPSIVAVRVRNPD